MVPLAAVDPPLPVSPPGPPTALAEVGSLGSYTVGVGVGVGVVVVPGGQQSTSAELVLNKFLIFTKILASPV